MKRTWIFTALFFCGLMSFSNLRASTNIADVVITQQKLPHPPSASEIDILKAAAAQFDMPYSEIREYYDGGNVLIEYSGTMVYVTVMITDGNPLVASLEDNF